MRAVLGSIRDGRGFDVLLVLLPVLFLLLFSLFPLVYTGIMSLQEVDLFNIATLDRPFVGLDNYRRIAADPLAVPVIINTALFVSLSVVFQLLGGFSLALFFAQGFPGAGLMRGLFLAGWIMPALVVGAIWKWLLSGDTGVVNYVLVSLGLIDERIFWLSDPAYALYAVIIANVWLGIPFNMLMLSVGLAAIPRDIYEAAELDGAGSLRRFVGITLPLMRAPLAAVSSLGIIFTLQQFDLVAALTQGGPSNASNVAQYWSWQLSFQVYDISAGSSVAAVMVVFVVFVAALYTWSTRHEQAA
ncbi:carbohydrate ABC transporter permease [Aureimonas pseudogalii]|uniref:Multiple sugar transport system permease protein n=1 Tax=Aureimonas pseudogalii TaxID=1744844 RepID=A0A7W6H9D2_9HYPH|nr:sugar ABC transporter permease [Aureimonas pseudogalii]MBB4000778.1 multiple sugar transport system permease protein [Aureimonas pseudogalii]